MAERKAKGKGQKELTAKIKLQIPAGSASPAPPIGPILGQNNVPMQEFCKAFNDETAQMEKGIPLPVVITAYSDRSFEFVVKSPPAAVLLRKAAGVPKGSPTPNSEKVGRVSRKQLEEIATAKMADLSANDMDAAVKIIAGTARSMGLETDL